MNINHLRKYCPKNMTHAYIIITNLLLSLFYFAFFGTAQAQPSTAPVPTPTPGPTPAQQNNNIGKILFNGVPDPQKWLNEFQARVNSIGLTDQVIRLSMAFIGAIAFYKIVRALIESNNAKMFTAIIYLVLSTTMLGFSKPDNGWQQSMRFAWGGMIAYSQKGVGNDITAKMADAMDKFGIVMNFIPVLGFAKVGTAIKIAKEFKEVQAAGKTGGLLVKGAEVATKTATVSVERALASLAIGASLINGYSYLIYYSGMVLVICSLAIPLTCMFIAAGNWKPTAAVFMTMVGCLVLGAIAPVVFIEVIEISYIRPMDAAMTILKDMATSAAAVLQTPAPVNPGGFLSNLNPLPGIEDMLEKVGSALAIAASAMIMLLALVIGGVAVGIQILMKLPDIVYGTLKS
jgi:hypothetical protein